MNISDHVTLDEVSKSTTAIRLGINNTPPKDVIAKLKLTCEKIIEPARKHFGKPIKINSGYRSPALNKAVGGSATSSHCLGEAIDMEIPGVSNYDVAKWISENCPFDQIILEGYTEGDPSSGWVHVSYREDNNRFQKLTAKFSGGKASYAPGFNK